MNAIRKISKNLKMITLASFLLISAIALGIGAFATRSIGGESVVTTRTETFIIKEAPPEARIEVHPKSPGTKYVWVPGYWYRKNDKWEWAAGSWQRPTDPKKSWIPAYWQQKDEGWFLVEGHWKEKVESIVKVAPPAPRAEVRSVSPGPEYVWVMGHWYRINDTWTWTSGYWELPAQPKAVWVTGHWMQKGPPLEQDGGWYWVEGYWKAQ